jgi:hypothetical protein
MAMILGHDDETALDRGALRQVEGARRLFEGSHRFRRRRSGGGGLDRRL